MKTSPSSSRKSHIREALIFGGSFLVIGAICLFLAFRGKSNAAYAEVVREGEVVHRLSLDEEKHLHVQGKHGELEIEVKGGKVAIVSSPCPSQFCVHQGYKDKEGESIICAYEGVMVILAGEAPIEGITV